MSIWKGKSSKKEMPWGAETLFSSPFGLNGKIIDIKADQRTSLKYYPHRDQMMLCLEGTVMIYAPNEKEFGDISSEDGNYFELKKGDVIKIQRENPYRIKALEDSKLIEVLSGTDSQMVRLEDDFGRCSKLRNEEKTRI